MQDLCLQLTAEELEPMRFSQIQFQQTTMSFCQTCNYDSSSCATLCHIMKILGFFCVVALC